MGQSFGSEIEVDGPTIRWKGDGSAQEKHSTIQPEVRINIAWEHTARHLQTADLPTIRLAQHVALPALGSRGQGVPGNEAGAQRNVLITLALKEARTNP